MKIYIQTLTIVRGFEIDDKQLIVLKKDVEINSIPILNVDNICYGWKIQEKVKNEENVRNLKQYSEIVYKKRHLHVKNYVLRFQNANLHGLSSTDENSWIRGL